MKKILHILVFAFLFLLLSGNICLAEHKEFVGEYGEYKMYVDADSFSELRTTTIAGRSVEGFYCMAYFTKGDETRESILSFGNDGESVIVEFKAIGSILECKKGTALYNIYEFCRKRVKKHNSVPKSRTTNNSSNKNEQTKPVYVATAVLKDWADGRDFGKNNIYVYTPVYTLPTAISAFVILENCSTGKKKKYRISFFGNVDEKTNRPYSTLTFDLAFPSESEKRNKPWIAVDNQDLADTLYDYCLKHMIAIS